MISHARTSGSLALILLTNALGEVPHIRKSNRDLQIQTDGAITLLEPGKGAHVVRISQTFVGNSADGCNANDNASNARIMFATFMDPDTLQEKCGMIQKNVTPCFQETVVVGCDPEANTATINLYVVDESFEKSMITDNPKMGKCKVGQGDMIKRAIKVTEKFDCLPLTEEEPNSVCSCSEDKECFYSELKKGYLCRPFAKPGDPCGGVETAAISRTCDPKTSLCYLRDSCNDSQATGICVALSDDKCSQDNNYECEKPTDFCDFSTSRCRPRLQKGDCCRVGELCADGLTCAALKFDDADEFNYTCRTQCGGSYDDWSNDLCEDNEFCTSYPQGDDAMDYDQYYTSPYCAPYASKGESCGRTSTMYQDCDPTLECIMSFTRDNYYDLMGICWTPEYSCYYHDDDYYDIDEGCTPCRDASDCESPAEEWCDVNQGSCKPRYIEKMGCDPEIEKQCREGLECKNQSGWWHCVKVTK